MSSELFQLLIFLFCLATQIVFDFLKKFAKKFHTRQSQTFTVSIGDKQDTNTIVPAVPVNNVKTAVVSAL